MRKVITTSYHCKCHDKPFETASKAYACEKRTKKEKEKQAKLDLINNEVRLRLKEPDNIWKELKAFASQYYGWTLTLTETKMFDFSNVEDIYCSHNAPIGKPRSTWNEKEDKGKGIQIHWPGWKFWVKGIITGPKFNCPPFCKDQEPQFTALTSGSFSDGPYRVHGCSSGTFNGGSKFSGEFFMFVEDFPKIKEKYNVWLKDENKRKEEEAKKKEEELKRLKEERRLLEEENEEERRILAKSF